MSFMKPEITGPEHWLEIEPMSNHESELVLLSDYDVADTIDRVLKDDGDEVTFTLRAGYGARLSAPGYMDCTDFAIYDSAAEAAQALIDDYYSDAPFSEMEPDALDELEGLSVVAGLPTIKSVGGRLLPAK